MMKASKKSPILISINNEGGDDKKNDVMMRRMDLLERKLDQQYKSFTEGRNPQKDIEALCRIFFEKLDKIIAANNTTLKKIDKSKYESMRKDIVNTFKSAGDRQSFDPSSFNKQLDILQEAIKKFKPEVKIIQQPSEMSKSLEKAFEKMGQTIKDSRPRVTPSPS
jgi:hypothetical protein